MAGGTPASEGRGERETELTLALAAVRSRLAAAAEAAGRNVSEIELLPITKFFPATDVAILARLGCRCVGESRDQEAAAKVAEVARLAGSSVRVDLPNMHWHMVGRIQRNKARSLANWAHTAHSVDSTRLVTALDRAVSTALSEGAPARTAARLRRSQPRRRRVPRRRRHHPARRARSGLRAGRGLQKPETPRLDGHPAAGLGPRAGLRPAAIGAPPGARIAPGRGRAVRRHVQRLRNRRQTRFDMCACRYRAIGSAAATVTVSSHCSHIFITDTNNPRG